MAPEVVESFYAKYAAIGRFELNGHRLKARHSKSSTEQTHPIYLSRNCFSEQ